MLSCRIRKDYEFGSIFVRNAVVQKMKQSLICVAVGTGVPGVVLGGDLSGGCWSYH